MGRARLLLHALPAQAGQPPGERHVLLAAAVVGQHAPGQVQVLRSLVQGQQVLVDPVPDELVRDATRLFDGAGAEFVCGQQGQARGG